MGQVTIEIPQNVNRFFQVNDAEFGKQLLQNAETNCLIKICFSSLAQNLSLGVQTKRMK
ncbi:hypothetical protein BH24ACI2_BH24ACI2_13900 [soil metagenome]|jgi:hypothetical protein